MSKLSLFLLLCTILSSCSGRKDQRTTSSKMMRAEEIVIPESGVLNLKTYYMTASWDKSLYGYNRKNHSIDIFDLQTLVSKQIQLEPEGVDAVVGDVKAIYVSSPDSIWLCDDAMHLLLLNSEGIVYHSVNLADFLNEGETPLVERNHAISTDQIYYDKQTDRLFFGVWQHAPSSFRVRSISLSGDTTKDYLLDNSVSVPDVAKGQYANMSKPNITFADGKIVYNYPVESHVYVIDLHTGERQVIEADSHYTQNVAEKCRDMSDYDEWMRHGIVNPHFFEVMYLPDLHLYARLHLSEHELSAEADLTQLNDDRNLYMTLFDDSFHVIEEIKLPVHRYSYYTGWCAFRDGICLFVNNSLDIAEKTESLVLDFYKKRS